MASLVSTEPYRHLQIVIIEDEKHQFFFEINNPRSADTIKRKNVNYSTSNQADLAARTYINLLPTSAAEDILAAIYDSHTAENIVQALIDGGLTIIVADETPA